MAEKHPTLKQQQQQQRQQLIQQQQKVIDERLEEFSHQRQQKEQQKQEQAQQQEKPAEVEKCPECNYKTTNAAYMTTHRKMAHPVSARNPLCCLLCDFASPDEKYINAHLHVAHQIKEDKKCPHCSNAFDTQVCFLSDPFLLFTFGHKVCCFLL